MSHAAIRNIMAAALVSSVMALATIAPASASPGSHYDDLPDVSEVVQFLEDNGVDQATIDSLIQKLEDGVLWDSQTGEAAPVEVVTEDGITRYYFADGSVRVLDVSNGPQTGVQPLANSLTDCTYLGGSGYAAYSNCLVRTTDGITVLQFRTGYTRWQTGASVQNWQSPSAATAYGSVTTATFSFIRASYSGGAPATVQAHTLYTHFNGLSSEDIYLTFAVTPTGWSISYN